MRRNERQAGRLDGRDAGSRYDFDRILLPYQQALEKLGVSHDDPRGRRAAILERVKTYDFDMIIDNFPQSHAPGNEQREYWGSDAADKPASSNTMGIKNPAVDHLIEQDHLRAHARGRDGSDPSARPRAVVEPISRLAMVSAERVDSLLEQVSAPGQVPSQAPVGCRPGG